MLRMAAGLQRSAQGMDRIMQQCGNLLDTAWSPRDTGAQGLIAIPFPVKPFLQGSRRCFSRASWGAA